MDRAEAFTKLGQITTEKQKLSERLIVVLKQEAELYVALKLPNPSDTKPTRKRLTKKKILNIRRVIMCVMRDFKSRGLTWLSLGIIVRAVKEELPDALGNEIETQVRVLATSESVPIKHNGQRGHGSSYSYTGSVTLPK